MVLVDNTSYLSHFFRLNKIECDKHIKIKVTSWKINENIEIYEPKQRKTVNKTDEHSIHIRISTNELYRTP